MNKLFRIPVLSRSRIWLAFAIAILADGVQLVAGPFGWAGLDQVVDVGAMLLLSGVIGFHPLFFPTFVAEFIPGVDMLPTWTGCVALVAARRWKQQQPPAPAASSATPPRSDVIDV